MSITKDLPFRIAESRGSTKVDGNLRWQLRDSSCFGIDKQKELVILPFRIAKSPGLSNTVGNLKGYPRVFSPKECQIATEETLGAVYDVED